jgi:hypothetical protein
MTPVKGTIRLPRDLLAYLKQEAARRGTSLSAEIIRRLEGSWAIDRYIAQSEEKERDDRSR